MKKIIFKIIICISVFLIGINLYGCSRQREKEVKKFPVAALRVNLGELDETLFYVGDIKAQDEAEVYPRVTGKLAENVVKEGQRVKKGDIVAYIDRDEIGFEFERSPVTSPIEGIVGRVYLDRGVSVNPNVAVAKIVDIDIVEARINIVEKDLPKVKIGQTAHIQADAYPEKVFKGTVDRISPIVSLETRTALVKIKIPNQDHYLKPGMFVRVKIFIGKRSNVLLISKDALIKKGNLYYVFVIKNNRVYRRRIEIGLAEDNKTEIIKGLSEGEFVVTMGNTRLKEGDMVEVVRLEE